MYVLLELLFVGIVVVASKYSRVNYAYIQKASTLEMPKKLQNCKCYSCKYPIWFRHLKDWWMAGIHSIIFYEKSTLIFYATSFALPFPFWIYKMENVDRLFLFSHLLKIQQYINGIDSKCLATSVQNERKIMVLFLILMCSLNVLLSYVFVMF